jgi:hypothetical protein
MKTAIPPGVAAEELLRGAHRQSYRYPPGFQGFTAALRLEAGAERSDGTVTVELEDGKVAARASPASCASSPARWSRRRGASSSAGRRSTGSGPSNARAGAR